ncbi:F-box/kelch-repeat protein At3g06240-like [Prosopis cineraria]|uniref:F-box/kelch-repeat protein At3g06240-like n=1 Tax=Prosopis cineraria TaxID=364024 RepID=UPI00240F886F|nr:F-box/kelch-repeat protein At3g06240-like [Prosopis cineraria]
MRIGLLHRDKQVLEDQNSILLRIFPRIVGSYNGLLCLEIFGKGVYPPLLLLWNPATREARKVLPKIIFDFHCNYYLGFGFSPIDNDYKIVRVYLSMFDVVVKTLEIYSSNLRSWKVVEFENLKGIRIRCLENVTINGVMFWIGGKLNDDYDTILSFDLSKEVCALIPAPHLKYSNKKRLVIYENKLGVVLCIVGENKSYSVHLWVMEENTCSSGERWNWTKIYSSRPGPRVSKPAVIWRNAIVFDPSHEVEDDVHTQNFYQLNLTTNKFDSFVIRCGHIVKVFDYMESLVSISNVNIIEEL